MADGQARIIVGASEVMGDRRHTYLLFERSDGTQTVVRGGPDARTEGSDLGNFVDSTVLGSNNFGNIRVDTGEYAPPYEAVYRREANDTITPLHADRANLDDPNLVRDAKGDPVRGQQSSPDWPGPGEHHERQVVWKGTDAQLQTKLDAALKAGQQINDAKLEYSPLNNNSNGVTSTLLKAADVKPELPNDKEGNKVNAPDFGEDLYKDVGFASHRSGYHFDGKQWFDENDRKIQPPHAGKPVVPLEPGQPHKGSFDSGSSGDKPVAPKHAQIDMRDPAHQDHAMYRQAYEGVARIDRDMGRTPDEHSERFAAAVTAQGKADGLQNIHHVVMNDDRSRAYAVDTVDMTSPLSKRSSVEVATAVQQPVEVSNEKLQGTNTQLAAAQQNQAQTPNLTPNEPVTAGPRMA